MEYSRTFIALEIKEIIKELLAEVQQKIGSEIGGIKWVKPNNLYLTLKFLGPTCEDKIEDISDILINAAGNLNSFNISVSGLGAFPSSNNPKVIWAGLRADDVLYNIQKDIDISLESLGFAKGKRPFSPHLTIGRLRDGRAKKQLKDVFEQIRTEPGSFEADRITFYKSDLMPEGPVYSELKSIQLSK
jgi:2'-5' RNA ligase